MNVEWIVIETIAVLVENLAAIYFLHSRYVSKYKSMTPQLYAWLCSVVWGLSATFLSLPFYDYIACGILMAYLCLAKQGKVFQKLFDIVLVEALKIGTSLAGASLAAFLSNVTIEDTRKYQDPPRLLAMIFIKSIQLILFYVLAKKQFNLHSTKKKPIFILSGAVILAFLCLSSILLNLSKFDATTNDMLIWLAVGLLFILIGTFLMYEVFVHEETRNIDLSTSLQRLQLESNFFKELDAMYAGIRTWRHEYKNNIIALQALINNGKSKEALEYLEKISTETIIQENAMLQTGNPVLDAVVSTKLRLAQSHGIEINIQAVYPENNRIADNDICAIIGNLLDNAIEACERMNDIGASKFISFSLLMKGKNLLLSIKNSFDGEVKKIGESYLTLKDKRFHGIGIQYVNSIVEKYQGHILYEYDDNVFETHVILPLISIQEGEKDGGTHSKDNKQME
ncbi:MAG: GHKL domain-containing protein [Oscillospiraceae bacterium]|jgi:hypothetical protein|nr:GHKL domain-containing protein [Oscillospiraceae bacterium]